MAHTAGKQAHRVTAARPAPLAGQQQPGHLAEPEPEGERRRPHQCRAPQRVGQGAREHRVGDRFGRSAIEGATHLRIGQQPQDQADQILAVDPAHPLPTIAHRSAQAEPERLLPATVE